MNFSSFFGIPRNLGQARISSDHHAAEPPTASANLGQSLSGSEPIQGCPNLSGPIQGEIVFPFQRWALPTQADYLNDPWHLRIWEKSRQIGAGTLNTFVLLPGFCRVDRSKSLGKTEVLPGCRVEPPGSLPPHPNPPLR